MNHSRRSFLKNSGIAALGLSLPFASKGNLLAGLSTNSMDSFGIQLWSVKEAMAENPVETLKALAGFGYKQIESFESDKGMFWGIKNVAFKKYMDDLGMKIVSSHCNNTVDFERKAAEAAEIGMSMLICPYKGPQSSIDEFKKFADEFNACGEICKKNGIRFGYHNHDYSFKPMGSIYPQDVMMQRTDKSLVDFEMDIFWVVAAAEDPIRWLNKYPGRFTSCHIKDKSSESEKPESVQIGKGEIDFASILKLADAQGMKFHIVEQEAFTGTSPMESAAMNAKYLRSFQY